MYDEETRNRALAMLDEGLSHRDVSRRMGGSPSPSCVRNWQMGRVPAAGPRKDAVRLTSQEKTAAVRRVLGGEHYRAVAEDVGCAPSTLLNWRRAYAERGEVGLMTEEDARRRVEMRSADGLPDDPEELKAMVLELQFQADLAREMLEIVKKDPGADPGSLTARERTMLARRLRPAYSLTFLTRRLGLPASTYHYNAARIDAGDDPDADIRAEVVRLFAEGGRTDGYRRIKAMMDAGGELAHKSEKRVRRVMRQEGLRVEYDRKRRKGYDSYDRAADETDREAVPNVPLREDGSHDFSAPAPNVLWVTDVTEFRLPDDPRKVYLSPVIDCFDSSAVGWKVSLSATSAELTDPSLEMACAQLGDGDAPCCHSDRGVQYHAGSWKSICEANGVSRSMSRKGRSPDNARMEGFFGVLKNVNFHYRDWSGWTAEEFCDEVDRWMLEYNGCRIKQSLGWKTPMEYRMDALTNAA